MPKYYVCISREDKEKHAINIIFFLLQLFLCKSLNPVNLFKLHEICQIHVETHFPYDYSE